MIINFINGGDTTELEEQLSALTEELTVVKDDYVDIIERNTLSGGSINFPENVSKIGQFAFYRWSGFTSADIPEGVTKIAEYSFQGCSGLTSVDIPSGVTEIGGYAFENCRNLVSINFPEGLTKTGSNVFSNDYKLTSVVLPNSLTSIEQSLFSSCSGLTSLTLGNEVTQIKRTAFERCPFSSITIPETCTKLEQKTFGGCSNLTSITCKAATAPTVYSDTFSGVSATGTLYIPSGSTYTTWTNVLPTGWTVQAIVLPQVILSTSAGTITETFPNDHIPANQYSGREDIYSITINNMSMGDNICGWCPNLSAATLNGYGEITTTSFCDCSNLAEVNITGNYTSIGDYVFRDIAASSITLNVVNLSGMDSVNSANLLEIELGPNVSFIGSSFFRGSSNVNKVICHATTPPTIEAWSLHEFAETGELWVEGGDYSSWFAPEQLGTGWTIHYISKFTPLTSITQMADAGYIFGKQNGASTTAVGVSFDAPTSEALWYNYEGIGVSGLNVNIVYDSNQDKAVYKDANTQQELSAADKALFEQYFKVSAAKDNDGTTVYLMTEITGTLKDHQAGWGTNPICGDFTNWVVYK